MSVLNFLRQALAVRKGIPDLSVLEVRLWLMDWTKRLGMDDRFQERYLNEGFSGGERKRNEILQMALMDPDLAVLDETDSGLDIDALRTVAHGINEVRAARPNLGILLITHYQRILDHLTPDVVSCCSTARSSRPATPSSRAASRPRASTRSDGRWRPDGQTSTSRASRPTSRSSSARSTASASSTSTRGVVAEAHRGPRRDGRAYRT